MQLILSNMKSSTQPAVTWAVTKTFSPKLHCLHLRKEGLCTTTPKKAQYTCTQQCERLVQCKLVPMFTKCFRWASPHCTFFRE